MIRVLIADDQALVRAGFKMILEAEPEIEVVGEAVDGQEAVEQIRLLKPDGALMDIRMPRLNGLEATREVVDSGDPEHPTRVLMLTTFDLNEYVYEALLAPSITRRLIEEFAQNAPIDRTPPKELGELTPRELEVFKLVTRGMSNAEIAAELIVSETTVKTHVARILMKLHLRDRVQAVVYAYESGVSQPGATE